MRPETAFHRFVRVLLGGVGADREGDHYRTPDGQRATAARVLELIHAGALAGDEWRCAANGETRAWLKRSRLDRDAFAGQHRLVVETPGAPEVNLNESPLARLAGGPDAFLERHHVETGERVRRLVERAQLQPRLTMTYSASRTAGTAQNTAGEISDLAADARRGVAEIHRVLPSDCAGVVIDVCGFLKGLQEVERERQWPRRSAKLVLRIGLDHLAGHYGLGAMAVGRPGARPRRWMEEGARPQRFE